MPNLLSQLSSSVGDRTNAANHAVAKICLDDPELLAQIAEGLSGENHRLAGDCAEVMTQIAMDAPEHAVPYADRLITILDHPFTRARWEAAHALAIIAPQVAGQLRPKRALLEHMIRSDSSIIVRDYTVDIVAELAGASKEDADWVYTVLLDCLTIWEGRHAGHALPGLGRVAEQLPGRRDEIRRNVAGLVEHPRGVVRKASRRLLKTLDEPRAQTTAS
jgi:hypothetical protein